MPEYTGALIVFAAIVALPLFAPMTERVTRRERMTVAAAFAGLLAVGVALALAFKWLVGSA